MQRGRKLRHAPELLHPPGSILGNVVQNGKQAGDAPPLGNAVLHRPCDDGAITDIVIDLAAIGAHMRGKACKHFAKIFLRAQITKGTGKSAGADHINEHENPLFLDRLPVAARQQARKDLASQKLAYAHDGDAGKEEGQRVEEGFGTDQHHVLPVGLQKAGQLHHDPGCCKSKAGENEVEAKAGQEEGWR